MKKIKKFIATVFIGGLVVILPIFILLQLFIWLTNQVTKAIYPLTEVFIGTTDGNQLSAELISIVAILCGCFLVGLLVRTAFGKWAHQISEKWFLERLPGYKMLREIFIQLQPKEEKSFSRPVLYRINGGEDFLMGFVTDQSGDHYSIFIPTSPSPMNGYVIQTSAENLKFVDIPAESMMKSVIACGVGSAKYPLESGESEFKSSELGTVSKHKLTDP